MIIDNRPQRVLHVSSTIKSMRNNISILCMVLAFLCCAASTFAADICGRKSGYHGTKAGCIKNEQLLLKAGFAEGDIKLMVQTIAEIAYDSKQKGASITCGIFGNGQADWYVEEAARQRIRFTAMCNGKPKNGFVANIESKGGSSVLSLSDN